MSALPEWLWPLEDEEAVQEAERLIEETHNTLRRMEAGMQDQRISGQHASEQAEKLKSEVNNKMNLLEQELKIISEPTLVNLQTQRQCSVKEKLKVKPVSTRKEAHSHSHHHQNSYASASQLISKAKSCDHSDGQQQAQNISTSHSLPKVWKNVNPKWSSSTAEQVVLTARDKVQDALAVARNVTASLDQHVSASSGQSRSVPPRSTNVGIFEVKSQSDKTTVPRKQRLGQMLLPSISIKCGLEKQSIPSFQVLPGEKIIPSNVSVYNMKYDEFKEETGEKLVSFADSEGKSSQQKSKKFSVEHQSVNTTTSKIIDDGSAVVQLSRQLAEVEELREVNQAQVNHVLRFLLSRVCNSTPQESVANPSSVTHDQVCNQQDKSNTTSSSDSSQYPIAYDSLSRFLETYKRAATQSMLARKHATLRKQKEAAKQKREIKKAQTSAENHLLIGPLRQATQVKEADNSQSKTQDLMECYATSSSSHQDNDLHENTERNESSLKEKSNEIISFKEMGDWNSPLGSSKGSNTESVFLPGKSVQDVSGEDYEDDWEEEDNQKESSKTDEGENSSNSALLPITEAEELVSSLTRSDHQKLPLISTEVEVEPSDVNINRAVALDKEHQEGENKVMNEQEADVHEQADPISGKMTQTEIMSHELQNSSNCSSMPGNRQDGLLLLEKNEEKPANSTSLKKGKQHQSLRRRTQVRHFSQCSSSSDAEMNYDSRPPPRNPRRWDLSLREDLQLQSAILLNWQLEDRLKKNNSETVVVNDRPKLPTQSSEVLTDVERRWQNTLDQLDQRLKMIEDNERIHHIANEIKLQSRQEFSKPNGHMREKHVSLEETNMTPKYRSYSEAEVQTMETMVKKSPEKNTSSSERKEFEPLLTSTELQSKWPEPQNRKFVNNSWQKSIQLPEDLTAELLKYSRMGILPSEGLRERQCSKSSSSSTTSSQFQQSSAMVSFSDGELRNSACGSCSCSEGEYCVCGGRKSCSERAPPDGSHTLSDGENFLRDVSQGEIPSHKLKHLLKDTSFGEITNHVSKVLPMGDPFMAEESIESDDIDWELK